MCHWLDGGLVDRDDARIAPPGPCARLLGRAAVESDRCQRTSDAQAFGTDASQTDGGMGACQCIGGNRTGRREADPTMSEAATSTSAPASRSRSSSYQSPISWCCSLTKIPIALPSKSVRKASPPSAEIPSIVCCVNARSVTS